MTARIVISFFFSFFLGSIPTAFLLVKKIKGLDIREHGSGNVGATNAFRVLGKKGGSLVFALDFLKGAIPAWLVLALYPSGGISVPTVALIVASAAILGHIFTPFLGFRGGKGVATGAGAVFGAYPLLFLGALAVWVVVFLITRTVSISSLFALIFLVALSFWVVPDRLSIAVLFALFLLILWSHRSNILRLLNKSELKFDKKN